MIWQSTALMTVIDLVIVATTGAALWMLFKGRARLVDPRLRLGEALAAFGVAAIGLFYLVDLVIMYVLPSLIGREAAAATVESLHLNYSWPVILFGVLIAFAGFAHSRRGLFSVVDELKSSQERYQAFVAQSSEGIWCADLERPMPLTLSETEQIDHFYRHSYLAVCNDAFAQMMGFAQADQAVGLRGGDFYPRSDPQSERILREFVRGDYRVVGQETQRTTPDGETRFFLSNISGIIEGGTLLRAWGSQQDITERKRAEVALRDSHQQLEELSRRLITVQETERTHVARELHDEIGQALTAVKLNLVKLDMIANDPPMLEQIEDSMAIVDAAVEEVRNLALDLRPSLLDDLGLIAALRWYTDRQASRAGLSSSFEAEEMEARPAGDIETACFRVAQEAITNVVRHSKANQFAVQLRRTDGELELTVKDDGAGFDTAAARRRSMQERMGLVGMEERVMLVDGRFAIDSTPGGGTTVRAAFPLSAHAAAAQPS